MDRHAHPESAFLSTFFCESRRKCAKVAAEPREAKPDLEVAETRVRSGACQPSQPSQPVSFGSAAPRRLPGRSRPSCDTTSRLVQPARRQCSEDDHASRRLLVLATMRCGWPRAAETTERAGCGLSGQYVDDESRHRTSHGACRRRSSCEGVPSRCRPETPAAPAARAAVVTQNLAACAFVSVIASTDGAAFKAGSACDAALDA